MKQINQLKHYLHHYLFHSLIASLLLIGLSVNAVEDILLPENSVDISQWKCKHCPFEMVDSAEISLGLLHVDKNSYRFGKYSALYEGGSYPLLDIKLRYRNEDTSYMEMNAEELGLDTRLLDLEMGMQGKYMLYVSYDEIANFLSNTGASPYLATGSNSLTLPVGWVASGSSAGMTMLPGSLKQVELKNNRTTVSMGAGIVHDKHWDYDIKFKREHRKGNRGASGAFFFRAAELVMPISYETDEFDVSASYTGKKLQTRFSYYSSLFSNDNKSLRWQNAFTPLVIGGDVAELALPPENEFHQLSINTGYQFSPATRGMATIAIGRMRQNDPFLASTLNLTLGAPALPRDSLDGKVKTLNANVKLYSKVSDKLKVNVSFRHDDRDNNTPQASYDWVSSDSFLSAPRTSLPYSFRRNNAELKADYYASNTMKLSAAVESDIKHRTFQEVERTSENTLWGKIKIITDDKTDVALKYSRIDRDASEYTAVPEIDGPENPLMRKYNIADRTADRVSLHINRVPYIHTQYSIGIDYENNAYHDSTLGLTESDSIKFNSDISYAVSKNSNVYMYYNREKINSEIVGSQSFSQPGWNGLNKDRVTSVGLGLNHVAMEDKLNIGMDFVLTRSSGEIQINTTPQQATFPDLISKLDTLKFYADYRLKGDVTLSGAYWFESYDVSDWAIDGVTETTVSSLLGFGEDNPTYNVNAIMLSMHYMF